MKRRLLILIGITLISLLFIGILINNRQKALEIAKNENAEYERYTENNIFGSSLMTLINKVTNSNEKNAVLTNDNGFYISNNENSIIIEVKFLESDAVFRMEQISRQGYENFIKYYNTMSFKCIKKEYHEKTKYISYLFFEQV